MSVAPCINGVPGRTDTALITPTFAAHTAHRHCRFPSPMPTTITAAIPASDQERKDVMASMVEWLNRRVTVERGMEQDGTEKGAERYPRSIATEYCFSFTFFLYNNMEHIFAITRASNNPSLTAKSSIPMNGATGGKTAKTGSRCSKIL